MPLAEVDDDDRPAPGELRLVQDFINTADLDTGTDQIASPAAYGEWLSARSLVPAGVTPSDEDVTAAHAVREALRRLALANNGGRRYPVDVAILNQALALAPVRVRFLAGSASRLEAAADTPAAGLARILLSVHSAMAGGTWSRLKACREDTCQWAFYDHSKNHSGAWCTMRVCGNRAKARSYRQRRTVSPKETEKQTESGSGSPARAATA